MRRETYSTPGPVLLNLDLPVGEIEIETANTEETSVELEALSGSDSAADLVAGARIEVLKRGDGHEVVVEVRPRHGISISFSAGPDIRFGTHELRLRVTCPHGASLDIRTKSADVQARGTYGAVEIKTASGDLQLEDAGSVRIKTASGDVHVDRSRANLEVQSVSGDLHAGSVGGDLRAQLVSGDVHARDVGGSISANTVSGDQRFEAVLHGRVELKAISGDVTVGIRRGARVFVDANTVSGSTSSEFELDDAPVQTPAPSDSDRQVEVFVKTVSGDIRLERAPAPLELSGQS
jgi:Putative adhesin